MVHTRATNKLKRAIKDGKKGNFIVLEDSDPEPIDEKNLMKEDSFPDASKGKVPASSKARKAPTATGKRKGPWQHLSMKRKTLAKRKGRTCGTESPDQGYLEEDFATVNEDRVKAFENRECIGERHVNIKALRERSSTFGMLIDQINFTQICNFPESTGFCLHLVRTFYSNAQKLREHEGGPMRFITLVRNKQLVITPQLIGEVIGMPSSMIGAHYLKGCTTKNVDWQQVVDGICMPETRSTGNSVLSKTLREEYRFLNYIVCYNILPNMQTKVLRWERMLYLYLLGHPLAAQGLNNNIPYIIWNRMTRYVEHSHQSERLPFPMIIMRILRKLNVDISSASYLHSQGTISDSTIVKSLFTRSSEATTPSSSRKAKVQSSEDDVSITSIHREQQRLSCEQGKIARKQEEICDELELLTAANVTLTKKCNYITKLLKRISTKMDCSSSEESD